MKARFRCEDDGWTTGGRNITSLEVMQAIGRCLEMEGPIIVEHWFYRGSCAPHRSVFSDLEAFAGYLEAHAAAGDAIHVWSFAAVCRDSNELASAKCPDENGMVPTHGAY